jgi:hypothetical protein
MRWSWESGIGLEPKPEKFHHLRSIIHSQREADGSYVSTLTPELIIQAKDFGQAQRVMRLVRAGYVLSEMQLLDEGGWAIPDNPADYPPQIAWQLEQQLLTGSATHGYFKAARIAAKASKKMVYQHALAKFYQGFRTAGMHWMETHPNYRENTVITRDPMEYVAFAQAIIAYYSVPEEIGAHINASPTNPSKLPNGEWNPLVLEDLRKRLKVLGIDPDSTVIWLVRGTTRIERKHRPPDGTPADWARGHVRDREISICDAISYASLLRSRVSAHRVSQRTRSLTLAHACNVQMLAREILMGVLDDGFGSADE